MVRGLALSGGASRGSFQVGALECLYKRFGYRPDVIAGTSVGAVNGIVLAQARTDDEKLAALDKLLAIWNSLIRPNDFYRVVDWLAKLTGKEGLVLGEGIPQINLTDAVIAVVFDSLVGRIIASTSLADLGPLEERMRRPGTIDPDLLASGVPLRMLTVSLETGQLRYATGDGRFLEQDDRTPVASALPSAPEIEPQRQRFQDEWDAMTALMARIEDVKQNGPRETKWRRVAELDQELVRARWRAEAAYDALAAANAALQPPVEAVIDPIVGALASAAAPGIFGAYPIGAETYVDGGIREIVPARATVQLGATEVVAIVCSTSTFPRAGNARRENFFSALLGSLTSTTLDEITLDDLRTAAALAPVTVIQPDFDVHDGAVVDEGLFRISADYGYMRAADVLSVLPDDRRTDAAALSTAVARLRRDTHLLSYLWTRALAPDSHRVLDELRLRKWMIHKLVESRAASGVAMPPLAADWYRRWEPGSSTIPIEPNPWNEFVTFAETTPAIDPARFVPDSWVYDEEGDLDGLYLLRVGATFRSDAERITAVVGKDAARPRLSVPAATSRHLPRVPAKGTVLTEVAPPGQAPVTAGRWIVDGSQRFALTDEAYAAAGSPTLVEIPSGALAQIPDGGGPYWLGGLVLADSAGTPVELFDPTPRYEGTTTTSGFYLHNRSARDVVVTAVAASSTLDTPAARTFALSTPLPLTIGPGGTEPVRLSFTASAVGQLTGTVTITCDDPVASVVRYPISSAVIPLGAHAELQIAPDRLDIVDGVAGVQTARRLTVTNVGDRTADVEYWAVLDESPPGQFTLDDYWDNAIAPGASSRTSVSFTPTQPGPATADLAFDLVSDTDILGFRYRRRYLVPVTAIARARAVRLTGPPPTRNELAVLDCGVGPVGTALAGSFWITNTGDAPLTVSGVRSVTLQVTVSPAVTFPLVVPGGGAVEVPVTIGTGFFPGVRIREELQISSDDPVRPTVSLEVTCRAAGPHIVEPDEAFDFGRVVAPTSTVLTFGSDGTDPVAITDLRTAGLGPFSVTSPVPIPTSLAVGATLTLVVTVLSAAAGTYADRVFLTNDGRRGGLTTIFLKAEIT